MLSLVYLQEKKITTTSDLIWFKVNGNEHNFCDKSFKLKTLVNTQVLICNTFEWSDMIWNDMKIFCHATKYFGGYTIANIQ